MPYRLGKSGGKVCVFNKDTGEKKGCSDTREEAVKHMAALYAAESKDKEWEEEFTDSIGLYTKEYSEEIPQEEIDAVLVEAKEAHYASVAYYGSPFVTTYEALEASMEAMEKSAHIRDLVDALPVLTSNIMGDPEIEDKASAIESVASELAERLRNFDNGEMMDKAISRRSDVSDADKKRAVGEYGNVTYADSKNKKYPIDTEEHIRAAWSYINMPRNAKEYSSTEVASIKRKIVSAWKSKIDKSGPPQASKESGFFDFVKDAVVSALESVGIVQKEDPNGTMLWKGKDGKYYWLASYSNNFRDRDEPSQIVSEKSHRDFVERVEKGLAPYPRLWLWHRPEWEFGRATWVGYDDSGFAMAGGYIYPTEACEKAANWLMEQKGLKTSHGMPLADLEFDPDDPTVIVHHNTVEISPLPPWAAANELTGFTVLKKEADMPLSKKDKQSMLENLGMDANVLEEIEKVNALVSAKAKESGLEHKENDAETPVEEETSEVSQETQPTNAQPTPAEDSAPEDNAEEHTEEVNKALTREEVAGAIISVLEPLIDRVDSLEKSISDLGGRFESEATAGHVLKNVMADTPPASLAALISRSVIGSKEAEVDSADPLAGMSPKETKSVASRTGVPFIDEWLTQ